MKPTGLPSLPATVSPADERSWRLWLHEATERVRREAAATSVSGDQQRGRVEGAQRLAELLVSSMSPPDVVE